MSRFSWTAILALLFVAPFASGTERFLATRAVEKSVKAQQARTADDDDDDDDSKVNAFTPVSEAEEIEVNGDDAADVNAPDDDEPEEVGFDDAGAEVESQNRDADE